MQNTIPAAGAAMPEPLIKSPRLDRALSFVGMNKGKGGGYDYWHNVAAGESYTEDFATGQALAEELMAFSGKYPNYGNSSLLGPIALSMEQNGATKGHKIGFWNTINKFAMVGAYVDTKGEKLIEPEKPVDKVNRLGWALAHALNEYGDGAWKAVIYPTSVRPTFAVGFCFLDLPPFKDPLEETINKCRDGLARMNAIPGEQITTENEEQLIADTYGPSMDELYRWSKPAITRYAAIAALKFMDHQKVFVDELGEAMRRAVLGYLEAQEGVL